MRGKSEGISTRIPSTRSYNIILNEQQYMLGWHTYKRSATDSELECYTQEILRIFRNIERETNRQQGITLSEEYCQQQLVELAEWGMTAYRQFFDSEQARKDFQYQMTQFCDAPTFISEYTPFPWEVLFEGDDYSMGSQEHFWGFKYTPARILNPESTSADYPNEHTPQIDMLYLAHQQLVHSHKKERSEIEKILRKAGRTNYFQVFGYKRQNGEIINQPTRGTGKWLLEYLDGSTHNVVHFACHCKQKGSDDFLEFTTIDETQSEVTTAITLHTHDFRLITSHFQCRPLIFLNACQSASKPDDLGRTFNLPKMFIKHKAAAVIATACVVPDKFAAAFARVFYSHFLEKKLPIGEALRQTRCYFLQCHHNPLGLAYGLYSPADYRLGHLSAPGVFL